MWDFNHAEREIIGIEGIEFPSGEKIKEINPDSGKKYLGILETDDTKDTEMKETLTTEYIRWIKKILKSHLNSKNVISAVNSRAVSLVRYGAGIIIGWTQKE